MTSILTNTSAMNALQTLKATNVNLNKTQQEIASGKTISSARDNAAVWAISKVMDSDVKGFQQSSNSLALGQSTIAVARNAADSITDLLTDIKGLVVSAQEENVDREKIQTDIGRLREQITSIVDAAQFNGLNLVNGSAGTEIDILSSLNRSADGTVSSANINIDLSSTDLSGNAGTNLEATAFTGATISTDPAAPTSIAAAGNIVVTGTEFSFAQADGTAGGTVALRPDDMTAAPSNALTVGDKISLNLAGVNVDYVVREGDTGAAILGGLRNGLESAGLTGDIDIAFSGTALTITNNTADAIEADLSLYRGQGGLSDLTNLTVSGTDAERTAALSDIEDMIQFAISASAQFGSAERRIDIQADFVSKITDSFKAGIGTLVDADMEEASARLQALQVQQQLGVQALSIANQSPQTLLSLFR